MKLLTKARYSDEMTQREYENLKIALEDAIMLAEMGIEENDESVVEDVLAEVARIVEIEERMRLETLLSGEYDSCNAIVSFHPGAGGTEAQDWASMLYRMYTRWAEDHGFVIKLLPKIEAVGNAPAGRLIAALRHRYTGGIQPCRRVRRDDVSRIKPDKL